MLVSVPDLPFYLSGRHNISHCGTRLDASLTHARICGSASNHVTKRTGRGASTPGESGTPPPQERTRPMADTITQQAGVTLD
jgi:hypothetical protein